MKSGVGTWSEVLPDGTVIGALVVCNAFGDVWQEHGGILAGARDRERGGFADTMRLLRHEHASVALATRGGGVPLTFSNTTLAVVATDATLTKVEAARLAQIVAQGGKVDDRLGRTHQA